LERAREEYAKKASVTASTAAVAQLVALAERQQQQLQELNRAQQRLTMAPSVASAAGAGVAGAPQSGLTSVATDELLSELRNQRAMLQSLAATVQNLQQANKA
jgi:GTP1/Obg family GTP-binding protein